MPLPSARAISFLVFPLLLVGCGDRGRNDVDSTRPAPEEITLPANATNWDTEAGPVMIVTRGESDTVSIVLPQATDSTLAPDDASLTPTADIGLDLFGRGGVVASGATVSPIRSQLPPPISSAQPVGECRFWPTGWLKKSRPGWRVGFAAGRVTAVPLDSIHTMSAADSAALAASILQNIEKIPAVADPAFQGLRFRIRSAYAFRTGSVEGWIADVVRTTNEEANPRLEHLFLIGERPVRSGANYTLAFHSRTAGLEEEAEITELLALVLIGSTKHLTAVVGVEYDEGGNLGLIERAAPGRWQFRWRSAYTGC